MYVYLHAIVRHKCHVCVCVCVYICVSVCINPDMEKGGVVHTEMPIEAAFLVKMQKS